MELFHRLVQGLAERSPEELIQNRPMNPLDRAFGLLGPGHTTLVISGKRLPLMWRRLTARYSEVRVEVRLNRATRSHKGYTEP